jgi:hypothetical protein
VRNHGHKRPDTAEQAEGLTTVSRRGFVETVAKGGGALAAGIFSEDAWSGPWRHAGATVTTSGSGASPSATGGNSMPDEIVREKIRRARLSGPPSVTDEATVVEMDAEGRLTILHKGTNQWVCFPGNENVIGDVPMSLDPMGMQWYRDLRARKPKPTNATPGLIYMLCGATQRSYSDPFDTTSPAIPIGPHWMVLWPFDAKAAGLGSVMRDAGTMVMFADTPWAHLHICGSPWDGNEYRSGDRAVWTMSYVRS